jgi:phosphoserine phosphatase
MDIFGFDGILGTKIKQDKEGKVAGYFEGADCMFEEKVNRINLFLEEKKIKVSESYCYTDSITDLPILNISNYPSVVSVQTEQNWATKQNFNQIVWK